MNVASYYLVNSGLCREREIQKEEEDEENERRRTEMEVVKMVLSRVGRSRLLPFI